MTREQALDFIKQLEDYYKARNFNLPPLLESCQNLANKNGVSLEEFVERTIVRGGISQGNVRPIRGEIEKKH